MGYPPPHGPSSVQLCYNFYMSKSKNKKNPIIVYWCPEALLERLPQQIMLDIKPKSLMSEIQKRRAKTPIVPEIIKERVLGNGSGYHMCAALHELARNIFVIKAPFDAIVSIDETGAVVKNKEYSSWFVDRSGSIQDGFAVDFDMSFYLFCEENLEVSITPPYMHKTNQPEYGFLSAVKWDISSWFRAFVLIYQLWPGKNTIYFKKDEPIGYLNFHTDREIIFKEYRLTKEIIDIANGCAYFKFTVGNETMSKMYERFTKTSMKKRLTKAIKENIIE